MDYFKKLIINITESFTIVDENDSIATFFKIEYFPFFFIIQCLYICLTIRRHATKLPWHKSLMFTAFMVHSGRVITAFVCYRSNPFIENPFYFPSFLMIWFLINASPFDIVYKICNFSPAFTLLQLLYCIIQTRQIVNGISIGMNQYPESPPGIVLISLVLSSAESFFFIITNQKSRDFSTAVLSRNLLASSSIVLHQHFHSYSDKIIPISNYQLQLIILVINVIIAVANDIIYGLKSNDSIDITFLTYFIRLFPYYGSSRSIYSNSNKQQQKNENNKEEIHEIPTSETDNNEQQPIYNTEPLKEQIIIQQTNTEIARNPIQIEPTVMSQLNKDNADEITSPPLENDISHEDADDKENLS